MPGKQRAAHLGPEKRREPILDAALAAFGDGGFDQASMNAIAERAGISKAVLYDAFPGGKEEMFDALVTRTRDQFVAYLREQWSGLRSADFDAALREGLEVFIAFAEVNPPAFQLIFGDLGAHGSGPSTKLRDLRDEVVRRVADGAVEALGVGGDEAVLVELYTRIVVAVGVEMARWTATGTPLSPSALVTLTTNLLMKGFGGVLPDDLPVAEPPAADAG